MWLKPVAIRNAAWGIIESRSPHTRRTGASLLFCRRRHRAPLDCGIRVEGGITGANAWLERKARTGHAADTRCEGDYYYYYYY